MVPGDQIAVEGRHGGQTAADRCRRQSRTTIGDAGHVLRPRPRATLVVEEREHVSGTNLDRVLADDREKRLQIMGVGPHRIRTRPAGDKLQKLVDQRMANDVSDTSTIRASHLAKLRGPNHGNPPRSISAQEDFPRAGDPAGGSPV
jgi:hypothetical protein